MPYQYFKIVKGPKRTELLVPEILGQSPKPPYVLNKEYDMAMQTAISLNPFVGYPGEPLDEFHYKIKPNSDEPWSDVIKYIINVTPEPGSPNCLFKTFAIDSNSVSNITDLFPMDTSTDRIRIDSIDGSQMLKIDGQPVQLGRTYLRYEFINVLFETGNPSPDTSAYLAKIHFTVGRKDQWGGSCMVTLNMNYKASLYFIGEREEQTTANFKAFCMVKNGVPGQTVRIKVTCSERLGNLVANQLDDNELVSSRYLQSAIPDSFDCTIGDDGIGLFHFVGKVNLQNQDDPYLIVINAIIESSYGNIHWVHPILNEINIPIYTDFAFLEDFNIINGVIMTSDDFVNDFGVDTYIAEIETPPAASVDMTAEILLYANLGTPPFTYDIADIATGPVEVVTQDPDESHKFNITGLVGDGVGIKYVFLVTVTDALNVVSTYNFDVTIKEIASASAVPVITYPVDQNADLITLIDEHMIASNGPILNFNATGLPPGLSIEEDTGIISGYPTTPGVYPVTLTATNSFGTSANFTWTITVLAAVDTAPVITSPTAITATIGYGVNYPITYTGTEPVTLQVERLPEGWVFDPITKSVYGLMSGPRQVFRVLATNNVGADIKSVTVTAV